MAEKLLLVDDDESIRQLVLRILERSGYEVEAATDGIEAVDRLKNEKFDGMLLDLMMPRLDGFGVIEHLRETNRDFLRHVVVLSAYADFNRDRIDPTCGIVQKPFEITTLLEAVEQCLHAR